MVHRSGQMFAEDGHGLFRLAVSDGRTQLRQRTGSHQAKERGFLKDAAHQGTEPAGHPRLRPLGPLQHGPGIQDGRLPVRRCGLHSELIQDLQDPPAHHRRVGPLCLRG
ncbi:hypothetical protein D3C73_1132670 [compost metagenome]